MCKVMSYTVKCKTRNMCGNIDEFKQFLRTGGTPYDYC